MQFVLNDSFLILLTIVSVAFSIIVIFTVFVFSHNILSKWLALLQKERNRDADKIKQDAYASAAKIMEDAKAQSTDIIKKANQEAQKILGSTEFLTEDTKAQFEQRINELSTQQVRVLEDTSREIMGLYKGVLEKEKQEGLESLKNIAEDIEEGALQELGEFKQTLEEETIESRKKVEEKIKSDFDLMEQELQEYKAAKLHELEDSIYGLIEKITLEIIGKSLSVQDHEDLVRIALDRAKHDGLFGE